MKTVTSTQFFVKLSGAKFYQNSPKVSRDDKILMDILVLFHGRSWVMVCL